MENKTDKPVRLLNRNFVLLWQGQFVSVIGDNAFFIAMMFWLKHQTGSASLMGLIMMVSMIPAVVLGPISGVFADRYSRWKIIVFCDLIRGVLILGFAALMFLIPGAPDTIVIALFAVAILSSMLGTFFNPAITASIPQLVPPEKLTRANSMYLFSSQITNTIGQGIGGVLFRILGAPLLFFIDGVSFIFSGISEMLIKIPQAFPENNNTSGKPPNILHDIRDGLRFILDNRGMAYMIFLFTILNFFLAPLWVLLPFFIEDTLNAATDWYGYSLAGLSLGTIIGYSITGAIKISGRTRSNLIIVSIIIVALLFSGLGLIIDRRMAIICMVLMGLNMGFTNVTMMTIVQQTTPDWIRGRVVSVLLTLSAVLKPVGMGLTGIVADLLDQHIPPIFITCGLVHIITCFIFSFSRQFRDYMAYETPEEN